jgi:HEAT repeat protein
MRTFLRTVGIVVCLVVSVRGPLAAAELNDLIKNLKNGDTDERRAAAKSLSEGGAEMKEAVPALVNALKDRDMFVRRFSAQALGAIGADARSAVPALTAALDDQKKEVAAAAAVSLGKVGSSGVATLIGVVKDDRRDTAIRRQAIESLSGLGADAHTAVPVLTDLISEKGAKGKKMAPEDLRVDAAVALGYLAKPSDKGTMETLATLTDKQSKAPRNLRMAANQTLRKIKNNK